MQGREIKFRVWDKDLKKMRVCGTDIHDSITFDMDNNAVYYNLQNGCGSLADGTGTYDLMQYTGLRDKNGLEIYEGDILGKTSETSGLSYRYTVEWDSENARFMARGKHFQELVSDSLERGCKVIGNVWEDGGLLNDRETSKAD